MLRHRLWYVFVDASLGGDAGAEEIVNSIEAGLYILFFLCGSAGCSDVHAGKTREEPKAKKKERRPKVQSGSPARASTEAVTCTHAADDTRNGSLGSSGSTSYTAEAMICRGL